MSVPADLTGVFTAFAAAEVRYLLVGGHAVGVHGRPRATKDVDVWLDPARGNVDRACKALARFGAPRNIVEGLRTAAPTEIVWLGRPPVRLDLLQSLPGVSFEECWRARVEIEVGGARIAVIGREDLIRNKEAVGRPQYRRDVRMLRGPARGPRAPARGRRR